MIENVSIMQFTLGVFTQGKLHHQLMNKKLHFTAPPNVCHFSEAVGRQGLQARKAASAAEPSPEGRVWEG